MDGFVLPAKAKNKDAAKTVLEYIGTGAGRGELPEVRPVGRRPGHRPQVPTYNQVQTASVQMIAGQKARVAVRRPGHRPAMAAAAGDGDPAVHRQPAASAIKSMQSQPGGAGEDHLLASDATGHIVTHDVARRDASRRETRRRRPPQAGAAAFPARTSWSSSRCSRSRCSPTWRSSGARPGLGRAVLFQWSGVGGVQLAVLPSPAASFPDNGCFFGVQNYVQAATVTRRSGPRSSTM